MGYAGEIANPLMHGGKKTNWDNVVSPIVPKKCLICKWVYPSGHVEEPKNNGEPCQPCIMREGQ